MKKNVNLLIILLFLLSACGSSRPQPTSTATALPPTVKATDTAEPSATIVPTQSPTRTPAPQSSSGAAIASTSPWLIVKANNGTWIANKDGSGIKLLTDETNLNIRSSLSPDGSKIAYVSLALPDEFALPVVQIMSIPDGKITQVAEVGPKDKAGNPAPTGPGTPPYEATRGIYYYSPPVWSPDGKTLAFIGAQDGQFSNLYLYTLADQKITRLTDSASTFAFQPVWSPGGTWIAYEEANGFGGGSGFDLAGVWAVHPDGSGAVEPYKLSASTGTELIAEWLDGDTFVVFSWDVMCGAKDLRTINLSTQKTTMLWGHYFTDYSGMIALDPKSKAVAVSSPGGECNPGVEDGSYLVRMDGSAPVRLTSSSNLPIKWVPEANAFFMQTDQGIEAYGVDSQKVNVPPGVMDVPAVAPDGKYWSWSYFSATQTGSEKQGVFVLPAGGTAQKIYADLASNVSWAPDGSAVFFSDMTHTLYVAEAPDFTPKPVSSVLSSPMGLYWIK